MYKICVATVLTVLFVSGIASSSILQDQDADVETAMERLSQRYVQEDHAGKADALEEFLLKYPESKYTMEVINASFNIIEHELDQPERMLKITEQALKHIAETELRAKIMIRQLELFIRLRLNERLLETAHTLEQNNVVNFAVEDSLGQAYSVTGDWVKALVHYQKALDLATAEALKADGKWENVGESYRDFYLRQRKTSAHTGIAQCLVGLGKREEALKHFATAAENANMNEFGAAEGNLNYLWGLSLKEVGKQEEAKRLFAAAALTREDEKSKAELLKIYEKEQGSAEGFEEYLFDFRSKLAPTFVEFKLPDYENKERDFSEVRGSAATMVVFWHPL